MTHSTPTAIEAAPFRTDWSGLRNLLDPAIATIEKQTTYEMRSAHLDELARVLEDGIAAALSSLRGERDALVLSTGEHITKRSEYLSRAEAAETSHAASRENFLTMQGAAAVLLKCAEAAETRADRAWNDAIEAAAKALEARGDYLYVETGGKAADYLCHDNAELVRKLTKETSNAVD